MRKLSAVLLVMLGVASMALAGADRWRTRNRSKFPC